MRLTLLAIVIHLLPAELLAHGGGLNADGCHNNRKTGDYHCHRAPRSAAPRTIPKGGPCGSKRYCKEMASCEEAMHYLNNCGVVRLDGDGDGVPCESICGNR